MTPNPHLCGTRLRLPLNCRSALYDRSEWRDYRSNSMSAFTMDACQPRAGQSDRPSPLALGMEALSR